VTTGPDGCAAGGDRVRRRRHRAEYPDQLQPVLVMTVQHGGPPPAPRGEFTRGPVGRVAQLRGAGFQLGGARRGLSKHGRRRLRRGDCPVELALAQQALDGARQAGEGLLVRGRAQERTQLGRVRCTRQTLLGCG
jgi:hypothetical protein